MATSRRTARTCRRPGCARSATATLLLSYVEASVRIETLHDEPHPANWDMCRPHADGLGVPRGWTREDRRERAPRSEPPPAAEQPRTATRRPSPPSRGSPAGRHPGSERATAPRPNRYAALTACLPQIAASLAAALQPEDGPLPPDIPGQLRLPGTDAADEPEPAEGLVPDAAVRDDARSAAPSAHRHRTASTPDNVVPLLRRGVLDPIG